MTRLDKDHAGGIETGAGQRRRVEVAAGRDPQHRADTAGQHSRGEQRRGGAVLDSGTAGKQLVHRAEGETLAGQMRVQLWKAERQARRERSGAGPTLKRRDLHTQGRNVLRPHRPRSSLIPSHNLENLQETKECWKGCGSPTRCATSPGAGSLLQKGGVWKR